MSRPRTDVEPTDKTYIGPQADADVGPMGKKLHRPAGGCRCWPDKFADVEPMDKTYIGPQADADVGPMGKKLHRPAGGCRCWPDKFAALGPMLSRRTKLTSARRRMPMLDR